MKLLVEFEFDDSWDYFYSKDEDKLKMFLRHDLDGVETKIIKKFQQGAKGRKTTEIN